MPRHAVPQWIVSPMQGLAYWMGYNRALHPNNDVLGHLGFGFVTKFGVRGLGSTYRNSPKSLLCIDFYFQINNNKIDNQAILVVCLLKFWARSPYV